MKYGVIDIGSNSVRLMMSEGGSTLFKLSVITRLAAGMNVSGKIGEVSAEKTLSALSFFVSRAEKEKVDKLFCFATSAVRTAENGAEFTEKVKTLFDIDVDVVSEQTEAEIGSLGALGGKDGGIIDIGGGSTEIFVVKDGKRVYSASVPVGAVRMTDTCGQDEAAADLLAKSTAHRFGNVPRTCFVAIGGTATSAAAISLKLSEYSSDKVDGYVMTAQRLKSIKKELFSMSVEERSALSGMQKGREEIIASGMALLVALTDYIGINEISISDKDNLEGYLLRKIHEQKN